VGSGERRQQGEGGEQASGRLQHANKEHRGAPAHAHLLRGHTAAVDARAAGPAGPAKALPAGRGQRIAGAAARGVRRGKHAIGGRAAGRHAHAAGPRALAAADLRGTVEVGGVGGEVDLGKVGRSSVCRCAAAVASAAASLSCLSSAVSLSALRTHTHTLAPTLHRSAPWCAAPAGR
jgi:hypothetical protein